MNEVYVRYRVLLVYRATDDVYITKITCIKGKELEALKDIFGDSVSPVFAGEKISGFNTEGLTITLFLRSKGE